MQRIMKIFVSLARNIHSRRVYFLAKFESKTFENLSTTSMNLYTMLYCPFTPFFYFFFL